MITTPIYGQQQDNNTFVQTLIDISKAEEQQKQQERILNITKLWEEADLIDFDRDVYNPLYLPAKITYQSNNTIVLLTDQSGGGGARFWGAVETLTL